MACLIVSHTSIHNFFYLGDVQGPKSRLKVGEKTEKEKVDTPSDLKAAVVKDKEKEKIAAIPVPVPQKESKSGAAAVAVAALLNSNKANSTTSDSVSSSSKLDAGTKGGISVVPVLETAASQSDKSTSAILRSIVESMVGSSTADNSQVVKVVAPAPAVTVTVTAPLPVKAAQEMVPPSAPSSSASASATTSMVEALFLSSPLLTTANRTTIQNFFSDDWRSHFPPAFTAENPVLKIKLSTEEKVCNDALPIHFFILLSLFISLSFAFFLSISFSPSLILSQSL